MGLMPALGSLATLKAALQTAQVQFALASMGGQTFAGSMTAVGISIRGLFAALGPGGWILLGLSTIITLTSLLHGSGEEMSENAKELLAERESINPLLATSQIIRSHWMKGSLHSQTSEKSILII